MLRCRLFLQRPVSITAWPSAVQRCVSTARGESSSSGSGNNTSTAADDDALRTARSWLAGLHAEALPLKSIGELSFSRSSGPGGQNVNKYDQLAKSQRRAILNMSQRVNSKATLRVPLDALLHHVPTALHGEIKRSRYVAAKANAMIVQADDSRKQSDNAHSCYKRLFAAIVEAGHHAVPNETSAEQSQRVKNLYVVRPGIGPDDPSTDKKQAEDR
jgi:peptidyl-tRNA hydrolase ICT1